MFIKGYLREIACVRKKLITFVLWYLIYHNMKYPEEFDTNDELREYVIRIIQKVGICTSLKQTHPDVYTFFVSLFQRHPEKERKEVSRITDISIRRFPKSNPRQPLAVSDHQFFLRKNNGTEDSISWNTCVRGDINPVEKRLNWAMRHAIEEQIRDFKSKHPTPCEFCKATVHLTVDHIIKFKQLKDDFLVLHPEYPKEFGKNTMSQEVFREEDTEYSELWQNYHYSNATLRILCKDCNQTLDNYGAHHI